MQHQFIQTWVRLIAGTMLSFLLLSATLSAQKSTDNHLLLGKTDAQQGRWKEAEEHFRIYRQVNPKSPEATVLHARALVQLNQPFDAVLELEELLAAVPDAVPALKLYAGLLDAVVDDDAQAEEVLVRCTTLAPDDLEVWTALAHHYLSHQKSADAIRCFEQALRLAPDDPTLVAGLASAFGQADQPQRATELFTRALKLNEPITNRHHLVYLSYAEYLLKQERAAESLPLFDKSLELNARSSNALYGRAAAYEKLKDLKRAEQDALAAARESPKRRDARQLLLRIYRAQRDQEKMLGEAAAIEKLTEEETAQYTLARSLRLALRTAEPLLREGKFADAAKHYEEIVRLLPTFYEAYFALGVCYFQTARLDQSETSFRKYLSFQPLSADGHASLGLLLMQQARHAEARQALSRALQLDPSLNEARKALARTYFINKDFTAVVHELERVLIDEPRAEPEVYVMLATAHFNMRAREKAIETSERGLQLHPDSEALDDFYAALLVECGAQPECRLKLAQNLQRRPNSPAYLKAVGKFLLQQDPRHQQAEEMLSRIVRALPQDAEARYLYAQWAHLNGQFQISLDTLKTVLAAPIISEQLKMQAHVLTALARDGLNDADGAEAAFRESLAINEKLPAPSPLAAHRYAEFLIKRTRDAEAQSIVEKILSWSPAFAPARMERAKFLAKRGELKQAITEAQTALQNSTNDPEQQRAAHTFLAKTLFAIGRRDEAQIHQRWVESHGRP